MRRNSKSVRMGLITLFTLISILLLAVMAVLSVTTSNAMYSVTSRQANATSEGYELEAAAQEFMANVDESLATSRSAGYSQQSGLTALENDLASIKSEVQADNAGVTVSASVSGTSIDATFETANGRHLETRASVTSSLTYNITQWNLTTVQSDNATSGNLWSGTS